MNERNELGRIAEAMLKDFEQRKEELMRTPLPAPGSAHEEGPDVRTILGETPTKFDGMTALVDLDKETGMIGGATVYLGLEHKGKRYRIVLSLHPMDEKE